MEFGVKPRVSSVVKTPEGSDGNFLTGLGKSALATLHGVGSLGEDITRKVIPGDLDKYLIGEKGDTSIAEQVIPEESFKTRGTSEKVGKFVGDVAQFLIPGSAATKATKALSVIPRIASRAAVSGLVGAAQTGDIKGGAYAAAGEAVAPGVAKAVSVAAKPATALMGRLFKGIASGLSGASSQQIEAVLANPKSASKAVSEIKKAGGAAAIRKNASTIVEGLSRIRKEAGQAYRAGLNELSDVDIKPSVFRDSVKKALDKFGSVVSGGVRKLSNVEFDDPKHVKKASELIDRLSRVELNGVTLRKLADDIESVAYKTATSDERLSFNAFIRELSSALRTAVSESTSKLDDINRAYSLDMQMAEEIQSIFGKVKFKNTKEVLAVSKKLESLFSQKGLAPDSIDRFLTRIGVEPSDFRAGEASRQMGELAPTANTIGTNPFEIVRSFTSAVVPPQAVRSLAIMTGMAEDVLSEIADKLSVPARELFVRMILGQRADNAEQANEPR